MREIGMRKLTETKTRRCWNETIGDQRFSSRAQEIASNHSPCNIEFNILLPKGVLKDEIQRILQQAANPTDFPQDCDRGFSEKPFSRSSAGVESTRTTLLKHLKKMMRQADCIKPTQIESEPKEFYEEPKQKLAMSSAVRNLYNNIPSHYRADVDLMQFCTGSKDLNVAFQHFIMDSNYEVVEQIRLQVINRFETFINNKNGNYLIQKLIQRDQIALHQVFLRSLDNFRRYALNEYASRVMQTLIELHPQFRLFVHSYFSSDLAFSYTSITVTFLLLIAMRFSENSTEYLYVYDHLRRDPSIFEIKLFKRVLIAYFQFADKEMTGDMWKLLLSIEPFENLFDKKFSSLILLMVVRRSADLAMKDIAWYISSRLPMILKKKYFKVVLQKLFQPKYSKFRHLLNVALTQVPFEHLERMKAESDDEFNYYLYFAVGSFAENQAEELETFLGSKLRKLLPPWVSQM